MGVLSVVRVAAASLAMMMAGLLLAGSASAGPDDVPTATVTGPVAVTADSYPYLATDIDLDQYDYVEEEFFLEGEGYRYNTPLVDYDAAAERIDTGGDEGKYPFKTRIVVRRPVNPADANGIVVAEWNNVTSTQDVEFNWFGDPYYLLKNGYTFVGVTAQTIGVNSLKNFNNARYGSLGLSADPSPGVGIPGQPGYVAADSDPLSFDVFSSVVKALKGGRSGADPLGGIVPSTVIASGESQSCGRLSTHFNKIQPLHQIVDAYLLTVCNSQLRTDRPEKAIRIISETENRIPRPTSTYPDTDSIRHWEVAAASHLPRIAFDNLNGVFSRDFIVGTAECEKFPLSRIKWPYTQNAAIDALVRWGNGGAAPMIAPRGEYLPDDTLARDEYGIAKGGIRYPDVTVPTAVNDGINAPVPGGPLFSAFCGLFGSSTPFTPKRLHSLYYDQSDYLEQYHEHVSALVPTGFILQEDADRLMQDAREFARLRPSSPRVIGGRVNRGNFQLRWIGTEAPDTTWKIERAPASRRKPWSKVKPRTVRDGTASLRKERQGTFIYRVRSTSILPGTNISPPETVTTPPSANSSISTAKVDRTGPVKPRIILKGRKVKGVYRGPVRVRVIGKRDRKLPDGTVGVGLKRKSVPKPRTVRKKGRTVIKVRTRDKLGNKSPVARVVVRIKR